MADTELAHLILRQGELRLQDQLHRAIASDHRASAMAGFFVASGLAAIGYGMGERGDLPLFYACLAAGITLWLCGCLCIFSAWPAPFGAVGSEPNNWWGDDVEIRPIEECLKKESYNYQKRIDHNKRVHARATQLLRGGMSLGVLSPAIAILVWGTVRLATA